MRHNYGLDRAHPVAPSGGFQLVREASGAVVTPGHGPPYVADSASHTALCSRPGNPERTRVGSPVRSDVDALAEDERG